MNTNQTHCGGHFATYTNSESLYHTPKIHMLYVNYAFKEQTENFYSTKDTINRIKSQATGRAKISASKQRIRTQNTHSALKTPITKRNNNPTEKKQLTKSESTWPVNMRKTFSRNRENTNETKKVPLFCCGTENI